MMRKDEVEDKFRAMFLEYNQAHDFWCLPIGWKSPYSFKVRVFTNVIPEDGTKWETQISINSGKMSDDGKWHHVDHGLKIIQKIIHDLIDSYDKNRD